MRLRKVWLLVVILLILAAVNAERVGRHYYPLPYRDSVFHYSQVYRLDPYLLAAIIRTESNFKATARSPKGAMGLMQIMPNTGRWIAEQLGEDDFEPDYLFDPEMNIEMGSWYLASLYDQFDGDPILVLAAYNGGRGNVTEWLDNSQWSGEARTLDQIPFPETRRYVRKVLATYRIYHLLYRN
ncbi:MAG: lytic transglycosylase domain-containing protein [Clostridia bacterium]|nr:lytic transglycosylase domain-containing protein [Clostridia bacterium]MDQ7791424.1 lytic transglycosylase domain-containing protein [Clostridia bacterium]